MDSSRRQIAVYAVIGFLIGAAGIVAAAHISGTVPMERDVPLTSPDGLNVTVVGTTNISLEDPFPLDSQVEVVTEAGNATFTAAGEANLSVQTTELTGTWTNVTEVDTNGNAITIDPADKDSAVIGQDIDEFSYISGIAADDGTVDFFYAGASGTSRVTVQGLSADTDYAAVNQSTDTILEFATSDGSGQVTFDSLPNSEHNVLIQQDSNDAPVLSDPSPTGGVTSNPSTFEIDVNDTQFPQGDSVTAELIVEGTNEGSDTLTSNGTASVSFQTELGKTYDYYWIATDSFGAQTVSQNLSVSTPTNLTIRNETNASEVITGADVTILMYSTDATIVVERSDTNGDGNISMSGLPDKEFVAVVEADGWYQRRVYIESIYNQQNIFLLNKTAVPGSEAINTTFVFEDRTGEYDPESTSLRIQRALDVNNDDTFEWLTVAGDFWGAASEFPFTGQENARYRLIVENEDGDRRVLGTHIPVADGTKTIVNGEIRFEAGNATGRYFDANLSQADDDIQVLYQDPENETGDIRVRIWELNNQSNEIHDANYTNSPYGRLFVTKSLTAGQSETNWVVKLDSTADGEEIDLRVTVGGVAIPLPMDPWLLASFGVMAITFIGTLYGPRTATGGAWMVVFAAIALTAFGWVGFPIASLLIAASIAGAGTFYKEALP